MWTELWVFTVALRVCILVVVKMNLYLCACATRFSNEQIFQLMDTETQLMTTP